MFLHWAWKFVASTLLNIQFSTILSNKYVVIGWNFYEAHIRMAIFFEGGIQKYLQKIQQFVYTGI